MTTRGAKGAESGAIQGAMAGGATLNPWAALGGAVIGGYGGWRGAVEDQKRIEAARRHEDQQDARNLKIASIRSKYGRGYNLPQKKFYANARNPALGMLDGITSGGLLGASLGRHFPGSPEEEVIDDGLGADEALEITGAPVGASSSPRMHEGEPKFDRPGVEPRGYPVTDEDSAWNYMQTEEGSAWDGFTKAAEAMTAPYTPDTLPPSVEYHTEGIDLGELSERDDKYLQDAIREEKRRQNSATLPIWTKQY